MDNLADSLGFIVAAILTLCVFSYLLGDNALYRLAEHLFVGVAIGYVTIVAFHQIIIGKLLVPIGDIVGKLLARSAGSTEAVGPSDMFRLLLLLIPLVLGVMLLFKSSRRPGLLSWLGSLTVAFLLGVGAAVAIAGGLLGTLLPQVNATADLAHYATRYGPGLALFSGVIALVGTVGVLLHFYFGRRSESRLSAFRNSLVQSWGGIGWWFVLIAFGAILATTFLSRLSLLAGRIQFLLDGVRQLRGG